MGLPDYFIDNLARRVIAGTADNARVPRTLQMSLHMGSLTAVDPSTGTVHFSVNGSDLVIPGVRYLQAYGPNNEPAPGHVVWAHHTGTDLLILGQHVVPTGSVSF